MSLSCHFHINTNSKEKKKKRRRRREEELVKKRKRMKIKCQSCSNEWPNFHPNAINCLPNFFLKLDSHIFFITLLKNLLLRIKIKIPYKLRREDATEDGAHWLRLPNLHLTISIFFILPSPTIRGPHKKKPPTFDINHPQSNSKQIESSISKKNVKKKKKAKQELN